MTPRRRWLRRLLIGLGVIGVVLVVTPYLVPLPGAAGEPIDELAGPDGRFIELDDGARIHVMEAGDPGDPTVVLVHGFGGSTWSWRDTLPALEAAGYRTVALDLRGFGLSEKTLDGDHSHRGQAEVVGQVMDSLDIGRAVVVGHSMGGDVAVRLAQARPDLVRGLVLVDAATGGPVDGGGGPLGLLMRVPPVERTARILVRSIVNDRWMTDTLASAWADPTLVTADVADGYLLPLQATDWDLALIRIFRDRGANATLDEIAALEPPVAVVWGRDDAWIPLERGRTLADAVRGDLVIIDGAGHLPMEERPEAFESELIRFLEGLP